MPSIIEQDDEMDDMMLFPITDIDSDNNNEARHNFHNEIHSQNINKSASFNFKPAMSLRERRWSKIGLHLSVAESDQLQNLHLNVLQAQQSFEPKPTPVEPESPISSVGSSSPKLNWLRAFKKIRHLKDPWAKFKIGDLPSERVTRHRYNALKKKWVTDEVHVKMEKEVRMN